MMNDLHSTPGKFSAADLGRIVFSLVVAIVALALLYGGGKLVGLGGSSYYLIAGFAYLALAILFFLKKRSGAPLSVAIFLATCAWALYEVGQFSYWELLPRVVVPAVILMFSLWVGAALPGSSRDQRRWATGAAWACSRPWPPPWSPRFSRMA